MGLMVKILAVSYRNYWMEWEALRGAVGGQVKLEVPLTFPQFSVGFWLTRGL